MDPEKRFSRRSFMGIGTAVIGALISAGMAVPAIAYIIGPALQKNEGEEWLYLGSAGKVELGVPTLFKTTIERKAGWIIDERELSIYVLTEDGRDYIALSNICTHLGCRVRWIDDERQFFCPCHNATFASDGRVVSGPPPRPLDRYEIKVEEDQLYILGV
jgi:Rieske Fe-S protein